MITHKTACAVENGKIVYFIEYTCNQCGEKGRGRNHECVCLHKDSISIDYTSWCKDCGAFKVQKESLEIPTNEWVKPRNG